MILIAPTAYKGTIDAAAAAAAMAAGARHAAPGRSVLELPLSDGGPGLIDALRARWGGSVERVRVAGPLAGAAKDAGVHIGRTAVDARTSSVLARVLRVRGLAVVESSDACGFHLVPADRRDPLVTTTYGVGELLRAAGAGVGTERVILGLGGSATVDGGAGMAQALGWSLRDAAGQPVHPGGDGLLGLEQIDVPVRPPRLPPVTALADVNSPLLGAGGAAAVFGPQKGADAAAVRRLERGLDRLATRIRLDLGRDVSGLPGAGAAGGLGAGAVAFLGAELVAGSEWVLDAIGFTDAVSGAELLVTGEGRYDAQTEMGKIVGAAVGRARERGVPVLLVAGRIDAPLPAGVTGVDGGGEPLTPAGLEVRVAAEAARLLSDGAVD